MQQDSDTKRSLYFVTLCTSFCVLLVLSNMSLKIFHFPFFPNVALTSGILTYPFTFLITDAVTEIWGKRHAKFMIFLGFAMNLLMLLFVQIVLHLPGDASWFVPSNPFGYQSVQEYQTAFNSVYGINGIIFIGSMLAYFVSQFLDIRIFLFLKKRTNNKHLWLRNNLSTVISQWVDTCLMTGLTLMWGLQLDIKNSLGIISTEYLYKIVFAILETPLIYLLINLLKEKRRNEAETFS